MTQKNGTKENGWKRGTRRGRRGVGEWAMMGRLLNALPLPLHGQGQEIWRNADI